MATSASSSSTAVTVISSTSAAHEKLLNSEALLKQENVKTPKLSMSANFAAKPTSGNQQSNRQYNRFNPTHHNRSAAPNSTVQTAGNFSSSGSANRSAPRPYRGFCQLCSEQGHTAKRCTTFSVSPIQGRSQPTQPRAPWQPRANFAAPNSATAPEWLMDSGASHHVTSDLHNLSLHSPYDGSDGIMIGDGSGLPITHSGSLHLPNQNSSFLLSNVLCVPNMKQNLISVSKFCVTNNVAVEFLPFSFIVKDLRTGARLMQGRTRNGVYEWPSHAQPDKPPILAFSSIKASLPD